MDNKNIFSNRTDRKSFLSSLKDLLKKTFSKQEQTSAKATAKAVGKALAAFDEVNILKMPSTSSGRSGSAAKSQTQEKDWTAKFKEGMNGFAKSFMKLLSFANVLEMLKSVPVALLGFLDPGERAIGVLGRISDVFRKTEASGGLLAGRTGEVSKAVGKMAGAWNGASISLDSWISTTQKDQTPKMSQGLVNLAQELGALSGSFQNCRLAADTTLTSIKKDWSQMDGWFRINVANPLMDTINSLFSGFAAGFKQSAFGGFSGSVFGVTGVPQLANGAVLPANKPFLAVVGDQKNGTNVEAPLSVIKQAVSEVVGNNDVVIQFNGDLAQLARVLQPAISRENQRIGTSMITREVV